MTRRWTSVAIAALTALVGADAARGQAADLAPRLAELQALEACDERRDALIALCEQECVRDPEGALEAANSAQTALEACPQLEAEHRLEALLSKVQCLRSNAAAAEVHAQRAQELAEELDSPQARWISLTQLAAVRDLQRRWDEARALHAFAAELAEQRGNLSMQVNSLKSIGEVHTHAEQYGEALAALLTAEVLAETDPAAISDGLRADLENDLGNLYFFLERNEKALEYYGRARELWRDELRLYTVALQNIGACLTKLERFEEANEINREALAIATELDDRTSMGLLVHNLAYNLVELERPDEALPHAERAFELLESLGDPELVGWGHKMLGLALAHAGDHERAQAELDQVFELVPTGSPAFVRAAYNSSWKAAELRNDHGTAFEHLLRFHELSEAVVHEQRGRVAGVQARFEAAARDRTIETLEQARAADEARLAREARARNLALGASGLLLVLAGLTAAAWFRERHTHRALASTHAQLVDERALAEERQAHIKVLHGLLEICDACKRIRNDADAWSQLETYIDSHSEATFTHGLCPDCRNTYLEEVEGLKKG